MTKRDALPNRSASLDCCTGRFFGVIESIQGLSSEPQFCVYAKCSLKLFSRFLCDALLGLDDFVDRLEWATHDFGKIFLGPTLGLQLVLNDVARREYLGRDKRVHAVLPLSCRHSASRFSKFSLPR